MTCSRPLIAILVLLLLPAVVLAQSAMLDGQPTTIPGPNLPANTTGGGDRSVVDIVGDTSNYATDPGRAKGNAYRIHTSVVLSEAEFWLDFSDLQTLTFYVFESPEEFGTYTEVYRQSAAVTGSGVGWYTSGPLAVTLMADTHYIIAVSWTGTMTYYFGSGDSQDTSFGAYVHGYASGYDPLPPSFDSLTNDYAIYHQQLTTDTPVAVEASDWSGVKARFR